MAPKAPENRPEPAPLDPELALIVERWDELPQAIRAGIMAMVKASGGLG